MLEERLRERSSWIGDENLSAELGKEPEELLRVPLLVEEIGSEHDLPGRLAQQRVRCVPANALHAKPDAVPFRVRAQESDGVIGPIGGEHLRPAERRRERRQPEPGTELQHALVPHVEPGHDFGERNPAAPELGPVRQELVVIEGVLVDQLVRVRRPQQRDLPAGELEAFLDQSAA